uniref:Uncharacterized protein n=1 Tax=Ananas comosus var. bracteatus TaxID=296719 RepID=A0A6V7PTE2_ANACO|nr:unnamed protein product [Ananas comosus var. bracteatus]
MSSIASLRHHRHRRGLRAHSSLDPSSRHSAPPTAAADAWARIARRRAAAPEMSRRFLGDAEEEEEETEIEDAKMRSESTSETLAAAAEVEGAIDMGEGEGESGRGWEHRSEEIVLSRGRSRNRNRNRRLGVSEALRCKAYISRGT